ncbi:MAG: MerR family transcriptional regulator [Novosphingobium sp.]
MNDDETPVTFDDGKAPDALRTIGEVANALGIRQHVLRYWEEQFPTLKPVKRSGGRRYYRPADVRLVKTIERLVTQEGYTLRGARLAIEAQTSAPQPSGARSAPPPAVDLRSELRAIRDALAEALAEG